MDRILDLLITHSYLILFFGVVIEGEIFPLAAGFLTSLSLMNLYGAIAVGFVGAVVGDIIWFLAARHWGRGFVDKYGKWIFLKPERLAWLEGHFKENGKKTLAITKFIYSFGHSSIVVAGISKMDFKEFLKVDVPACFLWVTLFVFLGHAFGSSFNLLQNFLKDVAWAGGIVIILIIVVQMYLRKKLTKQI